MRQEIKSIIEGVNNAQLKNLAMVGLTSLDEQIINAIVNYKIFQKSNSGREGEIKQRALYDYRSLTESLRKMGISVEKYEKMFTEINETGRLVL